MKQEPPVVRKVEPAKPATSVTVYPRVSADRNNSFGSRPIVAKPASQSQDSLRRKKPLAREPRIQTESMRDFADFIRSTGPAKGETQPVQPFVNLSNGKSKAAQSGSTSSISGLGRRLSTKQTSSQNSSSAAGEGPSARPRLHMEPRSAATQPTGNDDLIDFIRQGPPGANGGQHRIPRAVAPFRSTVDSDQFDRMLDENGNIESTYGSQVSMNSKNTRGSASSRTGLLPAPNVVQPAYSNTPQNLTGSLNDSEPQITRTRRRVKDPYAIDSSDEDEDLLTALPKSGRRQEESFLDFLNDAEPPPTNEPKPFVLSGNAAAEAIARARKATNPSGPTAPPIPIADKLNGTGVARNGQGLQQPRGFSTSITSNAPRASRPARRLQARDAGSTDFGINRSTTNDLADFLRSSGPPEPRAQTPVQPLRREDSKRLSTKFWRSKKT